MLQHWGIHRFTCLIKTELATKRAHSGTRTSQLLGLMDLEEKELFCGHAKCWTIQPLLRERFFVAESSCRIRCIPTIRLTKLDVHFHSPFRQKNQLLCGKISSPFSHHEAVTLRSRTRKSRQIIIFEAPLVFPLFSLLLVETCAPAKRPHIRCWGAARGFAKQATSRCEVRRRLEWG